MTVRSAGSLSATVVVMADRVKELEKVLKDIKSLSDRTVTEDIALLNLEKIYQICLRALR